MKPLPYVAPKVIDLEKDPSDLLHCICCVADLPTKTFCGLSTEGMKNAPAPTQCVVCLDIHDGSGDFCPWTMERCPE